MHTKNSFVDSYLGYAREFCHAPDVFHKFAALNALSTMIGPKLRMAWGDQWIYPNLWVLFLAESSVSAKTTAMNISSRLLGSVEGSRLFPNEFSREALVGMIEKSGHGTFMVSEFSQFMGLTRASYNEGVLGFLTDVFDVPDTYRRVTRQGEFELRRPCVNILACSTPDFMSANEDEWASGFGPRFLLVPAESDRYIAKPPRSDARKKEKLARFLKNAESVVGECVLEDPSHYEDWSITNWEKLRRKANIERAWASRLAVYVIKLAILFEVSNMTDLWDKAPPKKVTNIAGVPQTNKIPITSASLNASIELLAWVEERQMEAYSNTSINRTQYSRLLQKVVDAIKASDGMASRSHVLKRTRIPAARLTECVRTLEEMGHIQVTWRKSGNRKVEFYGMVIDPPPVEVEREQQNEVPV